MTTPNRRIRRDTTAAVLQSALDKALGPIKVPDYIRLPRAALSYWNAIIASRPRASWRAVELPLVADAARLMLQVEQLAPSTVYADQRRVARLLRQQCACLRALRVLGHKPHRVAMAPELPADDYEGLLAD